MSATADSSIVQAAQKELGRIEGFEAAFGEWSWDAITHGGSDRHFYRVRHGASGPWVVMHYNTTREENALFPEIADYLRKLGVQVPKLLFHNHDLRLIGLEDLGEISLHRFVHETHSTTEIERLYCAALRQVRILHQQSTSPVRTMNGFDEKLYRWERNYFFDHMVARWANITLSAAELEAIEAEGEAMAERLISIPRCLIHRDFQSQNLVVREDKIWLIDFQGMRLGHAVYDVASLLYDPYVTLTASQRNTIVKWYATETSQSEEAFSNSFYSAAAQRLMQALGAYGFLGLVKGKRDFLANIPSGIANLAEVLQRRGGMERTLDVVRRIQQRLPA